MANRRANDTRKREHSWFGRTDLARIFDRTDTAIGNNIIPLVKDEDKRSGPKGTQYYVAGIIRTLCEKHAQDAELEGDDEDSPEAAIQNARLKKLRADAIEIDNRRKLEQFYQKEQVHQAFQVLQTKLKEALDRLQRQHPEPNAVHTIFQSALDEATEQFSRLLGESGV